MKKILFAVTFCLIASIAGVPSYARGGGGGFRGSFSSGRSFSSSSFSYHAGSFGHARSESAFRAPQPPSQVPRSVPRSGFSRHAQANLEQREAINVLKAKPDQSASIIQGGFRAPISSGQIRPSAPTAIAPPAVSPVPMSSPAPIPAQIPAQNSGHGFGDGMLSSFLGASLSNMIFSHGESNSGQHVVTSGNATSGSTQGHATATAATPDHGDTSHNVLLWVAALIVFIVVGSIGVAGSIGYQWLARRRKAKEAAQSRRYSL